MYQLNYQNRMFNASTRFFSNILTKVIFLVFIYCFTPKLGVISVGDINLPQGITLNIHFNNGDYNE